VEISLLDHVIIGGPSSLLQLQGGGTLMNDPHGLILERYFWDFVDRGDARRTRRSSLEFTAANRSRGYRAGVRPRAAPGGIRQKPWFGVQNIVSRKPYRGINALLLGSADYQSPFWITLKQALDLGGHVRKGEKSTPVIYYKILEKRDEAGNIVVRENGRPARIPFARWANVFNLDQTEGIQAPAITVNQGTTQPCEKAAAIVENARLCPINHAGFAAYYSPQDDVIRVPAPSTFHSQEDYYHSLYHEMTHASGHSSRLNRDGITRQARFGSESYSQEELIAELGAAFLSNEAGILDSVRFENSAAYLGSWINKLENDPRMIVSAASQAQKASDFVLGIEHKESLNECQTSPEGMPLTWAREHGIDTRIPGCPPGSRR
jgi:antirestriction protein ArdC